MYGMYRLRMGSLQIFHLFDRVKGERKTETIWSNPLLCEIECNDDIIYLLFYACEPNRTMRIKNYIRVYWLLFMEK